MSLTITIVDNETGDTDSAQVTDGDFLIVCSEPCHVEGTQRYDMSGTTIVTIKDHFPKKSIN